MLRCVAGLHSMGLPGRRPEGLAAPADPWFAEALFDRTPDIVFFVKDAAGRYAVVNETLVQRCGLHSKDELLGHTPQEVFPAPLGDIYAAQDRQVLGGLAVRDRLELHLYPDRSRGFCLTSKLPLRDVAGKVVAMTGISRDLHRPDEGRADYACLARAIEHLQVRYAEPLRLADLARVAGLPLARFQRLVRRVFHLTPGQLLVKTRIEAAAQALVDDERTVLEVALDCGYADHSAFTRQFRATVGLTPREYRRIARGAAGPA